jgi:anion-transporting  ArsA/GET3 family ATPase
MAGVGELLEGKRVCICAGSGGVGKTTSSAAIAAGMAARGKKVAVLTIDPAKRLADSLGLPELGNEERRVDPELFAAAGIETNGGELWAMMLDAKATFDELVRRHAPDEETRDRILANRVYQQLSAALAGSQEYMAMEKLFELYAEDRYDLLVLDTPPTQSALDFLEAPRRLMQFIEGRALQVFMRPTGFGMRVFGAGTSMMFSVLRRVTGVEVLEDLSEFFQAFSGMVGGFRERAKRVSELLARPETTFLVVCGAQGEPIDEAVYFHRRLVEAKLPFGGVIVNKVHYESEPPGDDGRLAKDLNLAIGDPDVAARVLQSFEDYRGLAERDARNIKRLTAEMRARSVIQVPYLDRDVHDLAGLMVINRYLFAAGARERSAIAETEPAA